MEQVTTMKTWEKIQYLDAQYAKAREQILLGNVESIEVKMVLKKNSQAALLAPKEKNGTKSSAKESR